MQTRTLHEGEQRGVDTPQQRQRPEGVNIYKIRSISQYQELALGRFKKKKMQKSHPSVGQSHQGRYIVYQIHELVFLKGLSWVVYIGVPGTVGGCM